MTTLVEVVPGTLHTVEVPSPEASAVIADRYAREATSYVRLNMITSLNGAAAGGDGTSDTLTSAVDRTILRAIRDDADLVLVGAQTVRAEGYVLPRTALLAVVTRNGNLGGHRFAPRGDAAHTRVLIVCPEGSPAHRDGVQLGDGLVAEIVPIPLREAPGDEGHDLDPHAIIAALAERGHRRIVCEGGPRLAAQFVAAGAIDEFCITVAPTVEAGAHALFAVSPGARPDTSVAGMLVDAAGFSYLRVTARPAKPPGGAPVSPATL